MNHHCFGCACQDMFKRIVVIVHIPDFLFDQENGGK